LKLEQFLDFYDAFLCFCLTVFVMLLLIVL